MNKDQKKGVGGYSRQRAASAELLGSVPALFRKQQGQNSLTCPLKVDTFYLKIILQSYLFIYLFIYFCFLATPEACGSSQARGQMRTIAAGHSHSNARSLTY